MREFYQRVTDRLAVSEDEYFKDYAQQVGPVWDSQAGRHFRAKLISAKKVYEEKLFDERRKTDNTLLEMRAKVNAIQEIIEDMEFTLEKGLKLLQGIES